MISFPFPLIVAISLVLNFSRAKWKHESFVQFSFENLFHFITPVLFREVNIHFIPFFIHFYDSRVLSENCITFDSIFYAHTKAFNI